MTRPVSREPEGGTPGGHDEGEGAGDQPVERQALTA